MGWDTKKNILTAFFVLPDFFFAFVPRNETIQAVTTTKARGCNVGFSVATRHFFFFVLLKTPHRAARLYKLKKEREIVRTWSIFVLFSVLFNMWFRPVIRPSALLVARRASDVFSKNTSTIPRTQKQTKYIINEIMWRAWSVRSSVRPLVCWFFLRAAFSNPFFLLQDY